MDFKGIIGQKEIVERLKNSIASGRIGHAHIFSGLKGIGKKTVARMYASMLICGSPLTDGSCGECRQCLLFAGGSNPDYKEVDTDGASIGIEDIRAIQSDTLIRPLYSKRKVYLIIDAERMTVQAQNSLLKTLEEPPEYVVIILTTSNYDALIETIRSRAIRYSFKNNTPEEVREFLMSKFGHNLENLDFITAYSGGVIGTAMELAGSEDFASIREKILEIVLKLSKPRLIDMFELYDFFDQNRNNIGTILDIMILYYRDLLIMKKAAGENILINSDKKDIILSNVFRFTPERLIYCIETVETARRNIKQNANFQLSIEVMLMKLQEEKH